VDFIADTVPFGEKLVQPEFMAGKESWNSTLWPKEDAGEIGLDG